MLIVFDDWQSVLHAVLGFTATLLGVNTIVFPVYILYQVVEWMVVRDDLIADIVEYLAGAGLCAVLV